MSEHNNHQASYNWFTFGDFFRSAIGTFIFVFSGPDSEASSLNRTYIEENIHACYSISIAIAILVLSYVTRGILSDKDAWLTIRIDQFTEWAKFKKKPLP